MDIFAKWEGVPITAGQGFREAAMQTTKACIEDLMGQLDEKAEKVRRDEKARKRSEGPMREL